MDNVSHALWGGIVFGRRAGKTFLAEAGISVLPDALTEGLGWHNPMVFGANALLLLGAYSLWLGRRNRNSHGLGRRDADDL